MKFRTLLCIVLSVMLWGCAEKNSSSVQKTSSVSQERNVQNAYKDLNRDNAFYYGDEDALVNFVKNGTGVVFFGDPTKENSQKYIIYLNDVLKENDLQASVFDSQTVIKKKDLREQLNDLVKTESGQSLVLWNPDQKTSPLNGPLVLFLDQGKVTAWDDETSGMDDVSTYWQNDKVNALKTKLSEAASETKQFQKNSQNTGCEKACTFGGD